jgi:hypothetical protein
MLRLVTALIAAVLLTAQAPIQSAPSQPLTHAIAQISTATDECDVSNDAKYIHATIFIKVGHWAYCNHDAIEAVSGIGAVIVGLILAIVTGLLWWSTKSLARSTENLAKGAEAQAIEQRSANDIASQSRELAALSLDEAIKEHKLNWHKWAAEHRPILRVRLVKVHPLVEDQPITIEFDIINIGNSDATITGSTLLLRVDGTHSLGNFDSANWTGTAKLPTVIRGGEPVSVTQITDVTFRDWNLPTMPWRPSGNIRIIGNITYTDPAGTMRRTGFYRVSSEDTNRFRRIGDVDISLDYEYED